MTEQKVRGLYAECRSKAVLWLARLLATVLLVSSAWAIYVFYACRYDVPLKVVLGCWLIGPPAWFAIEYFYIYRPNSHRLDFEQLKYGQDVMAKVWLAVVALMAAILKFNH